MNRWGALLLGVGLGGFVDGIVLHQLLQWHHMISHVEASVSANIFADGLFHVFAWLCVLAGAILLVAAWQRDRLAPLWREFLGMLLVGWGLFNLVEGVVNHQILGIHHVRDDIGGPLAWDIGFLLIAVVQIAVGWWVANPARRESSVRV